jgi:peptide/nickel transport system permease protein
LIALLGILFVVFCVARLSGEPVQLLAPVQTEAFTDADIEKLREELGLTDPLYVQFWNFLKNAVQGDFGRSFHWGEPALDLVVGRIPATLQLSVVAFIVSVSVSMPIGILAAVKRDSWIDGFARTFALLGQSIPNFWLGILLILVFAVEFRLVPTSGRGGLDHYILPTLTVSAFGSAGMIRLLRSGMLDVLDSEYIKLARTKGLPERLVIWKHALRNAAIPLVTIMALQIARLASGSVVVETIFAWPGVGRLAIQALNARDYPVMQTAVFLTSAMVLLGNLVADILYATVDPRIRLARG